MIEEYIDSLQFHLFQVFINHASFATINWTVYDFQYIKIKTYL